MHAITYHRYGPPEVIEYAEIDKPAPAENQVLIRVRAASVNPYDWHFLRGTPTFIRLFTGIGKPKSPRLGADVAGIVERAGPGVTRFHAGDAVFGISKGAFAEYVSGKERELALKPDGLTFEQASAVPIAGITALQGLRDCGNVQRGQTVLINGAAGGVGTFAVQIAKTLGAQVTGVCSTRNLGLVGSLGADHVIDYTCEDFTRSDRRYDVIFDLVGNRPVSEVRHALHPKGTFVGCGGGGPDRSSWQLLAAILGRAILAPFVSQKLTGVLAKIKTADLNVLGEMMQAGKLTPVMDRSFPLFQTADAIRYVETGHARGKVTIVLA